MTFLEKAMEINRINGKVRTRTQILEMMCPYEYGLEEEKECNKTKVVDCQKCWNREMPNTELVKTVTLPMPPNTEPQFSNPVIEKAYNTGLNDAWELARKLEDIDADELRKMFGFENNAMQIFKKIYDNFTPQEALAKLKAYEEAQEQARLEEEMKQIKVGNVVIWSGVKALVMDEDGIGNVALFTESGCIEDWIDKSKVEKTGKHIDIQSILESIGE